MRYPDYVEDVKQAYFDWVNDEKMTVAYRNILKLLFANVALSTFGFDSDIVTEEQRKLVFATLKTYKVESITLGLPVTK